MILYMFLHVLTSDRCWPRGELQIKGIGHLNHLFFRGWKDGLSLLRAAKDDWDIKTTPAKTNSVSLLSSADLMFLEIIHK